MRVLVVEDNKDTLATIAAVLRFERYDVVTARNGVVALEMAKRYPPDVALLDIGLPGMDGYELAKALRRQRPEHAPLYIAAVTGYTKPEDKQRAVEAGFDAHLAKPAHPAAIIRLLEQFKSKP
ncbi:MAG TPA: response regulator [Burkholderiales bacterium]